MVPAEVRLDVGIVLLAEPTCALLPNGPGVRDAMLGTRRSTCSAKVLGIRILPAKCESGSRTCGHRRNPVLSQNDGDVVFATGRQGPVDQPLTQRRRTLTARQDARDLLVADHLT